MNVNSSVFCPNCKKEVIIQNERAGRCPIYKNKISVLFEELRSFLFKKWDVSLTPRTVRIRDVMKKFDLVSTNLDFIGDAKFYKSIEVPAAKWSTIAEYVWLLQFTSAKNKFLIFGRDDDVPKRWLKRYNSLLLDVKFYFFDHKYGKLQILA